MLTYTDYIPFAKPWQTVLGQFIMQFRRHFCLPCVWALSFSFFLSRYLYGSGLKNHVNQGQPTSRLHNTSKQDILFPFLMLQAWNWLCPVSFVQISNRIPTSTVWICPISEALIIAFSKLAPSENRSCKRAPKKLLNEQRRILLGVMCIYMENVNYIRRVVKILEWG